MCLLLDRFIFSYSIFWDRYINFKQSILVFRINSSSLQWLRFVWCGYLYLSLQIAMGLPLYRLKDIRQLYDVDTWGDTPIDFSNPSMHPRPRGHVIAARITSENPDEVRISQWKPYFQNQQKNLSFLGQKRFTSKYSWQCMLQQTVRNFIFITNIAKENISILSLFNLKFTNFFPDQFCSWKF